MKSLIFVILMLTISNISFAQTYASEQLKKHAIVESDALTLLEKAPAQKMEARMGSNGWEYKNIPGEGPGQVSDLAIETLREYRTSTEVLQDYHKFLDPGWVGCLSDDFWYLIKNQLNGEKGYLSTENINYTVCANPGKNDQLTFHMVTISWSQKYDRWIISSSNGISGMPEGSRFIRLK